MGLFLSSSIIFLSIIVFLIGFIGIIKDKKNPIYLSWFAFCTTVFLWSFGLGILTITPNINTANIFYFVHYLGAISIPITFLYFIHKYILQTKNLTLDIGILAIFTVFQYFLFIAGELCAPLTQKWQFTFYTNPSTYYLFFVGYFFVVVLYCFCLILKKLFTLQGKEKTKTIYFLTATAFGYTGGSTAFILVFDKFHPIFGTIPPYGIYLFMFFPILTTYAITKHDLMNINVIINRTTAWIITIFFFGGIYAALFSLHLSVVSIKHPWLILVWSLPYGVLVGETFQRVRLFIQTTGERKFIRGHYDSDSLIKELTEKLIPAVTISEAAKLLKDKLKKTLEIDNICIYVSEEKKDGTPQSYTATEEDTLPKIEANHPFIQQISPIPIFLKTLPSNIKESIKDFEHLTKGELLIPLFSSDHLEAFLIIGKKASENSYDSKDITLFETIMNHMLVVFDRIRPYEEVKEKFETTERKLMESEKMLNRSTRLASLGTLTAGVTHEIRNPLAVIRLGISKLPAEARSIDYLKEFKEKYIKHVDRIENIVDKMLHLSKEKERTEMGVDLNKLIEDYLIEFIPTLGKVTVIKDLKPIPQIIGIADDLHQVLTNFVDNALHAMPDGGTLTIKTYTTTEDHIQRVAVEISDTGIGIAEKNIEKIFDPFFSTRHEGTGLGLSISHKIIETHKGKIEVQSQEGKGTTFKIIFPSA